MSMTLTVPSNERDQQYFFPLPNIKTHRSKSFGDTTTSAPVLHDNDDASPNKGWRNHSRQYTVHLGTDDLNSSLDPPSHHVKTSSKSSGSSSRGHAHRRSAAISHDFSAEWNNSHNKKPIVPPPNLHDFANTASTPSTVYSVQSPALTFTSSASSLPGQSDSSTTSLGLAPPESPKVSFAVDHQTAPTPAPRKNSASSSRTKKRHSLLSHSSAEVLGSQKRDRVPRHEKVKSWAGTILPRFSKQHDDGHSHANKKNQASLSNENIAMDRVSASDTGLQRSQQQSEVEQGLFSSSYVSKHSLQFQPLSNPQDAMEPEPLIDLDLALASIGTEGNSHRRSESAPETAVGIKNLRNKMGAVEEAVTEEEEEDEIQPQYNYLGSPYRSSSSNTGSAVSINSSHSGHARFARSQLLKSVTPPLPSQAASIMPPPPLPSKNSRLTHSGDTSTTTIRRVAGTEENRLSIISNDTITENHGSKTTSSAPAGQIPGNMNSNDHINDKENSYAYNDTFSLGRPGFVRYSLDSDQISCSTIGTGTASVHSPIVEQHQILGTPPAVSSYQTRPRPHSSAYADHRQDGRTMSVYSTTDRQSLRSVASFRKRASQVFDWIRRR